MTGLGFSVGDCAGGLSTVSPIRLAVPDAAPERWAAGPFVAALGGAVTHGGRQVAAYPALLAARVGMAVANFGCRHAGPDAFLGDPGLCAAVARAEVCVIEAGGVRNLSNPFYRVHPRRNDRLLVVEPALKRLYPEVDFTEIAFTGHLMRVLRSGGQGRFAPVRNTLRAQWQDRMRRMLSRWRCPTVLWWPPGADEGDDLEPDPALVEPLRPLLAETVIVDPGAPAGTSSGAPAIAKALADPVVRLVPRRRRV